MAVRQVTAAVANASNEEKNLIWQMAGIINQLSTAMNALTAKLDADAGITDTDYAAEIGDLDTLDTAEKGTPA